MQKRSSADNKRPLYRCRPRKWRVLLVCVLSLFSGCAVSQQWKYLPATKADERSIYVVGHGWHTGVVLSREDLPPQLRFVNDYLPGGRYYEFGWGEAEFYEAEKVTAGIFLKAVFWRNPSVMHVVALPVPPASFFSGSEVVELTLSRSGLERLKDALRATFELGSNNRPYPLKKGLYGESRFFKARGYYVITDTCNTWTAKMLSAGGVPIDTTFTLRAAGVMRQVKRAKTEYVSPAH